MFQSLFIGEVISPNRELLGLRAPLCCFSPLFIGEVISPQEDGSQAELTQALFQSPLHRGSDLTYKVWVANVSTFEFQSPLHRGSDLTRSKFQQVAHPFPCFSPLFIGEVISPR